MQFNKYKERGDYHWHAYQKGSIYEKHAKKVKKWVEGARLLDVGAGDGLITWLLGAEGIDDEISGVELAQQKGVNVNLGSAYDLPHKKETFDAVFMGDTIEHLETPKKALREARRVLKKGGRLYITTPPASGDGVRDKYHYQEWTPEELVKLVESCGFESLQEPEVEFVRIYASFRRT